MAPVHDNNLSNNKVYNSYFPKFVISLSLFYIISYMVVFFIKKYKKYRGKRLFQEKKRLKQIWERQITKYQVNDLMLKNEKLNLPQSTYHRSSCSTFTSSFTVGDGTILYNNSPQTIFDLKSIPTKESSKRYSNKSSTKQSYSCGQTKREKVYWKINNTKRLRLLWQWSTVKGYVEYGHAKKLNVLISKLSKEQRYHCT